MPTYGPMGYGSYPYMPTNPNYHGGVAPNFYPNMQPPTAPNYGNPSVGNPPPSPKLQPSSWKNHTRNEVDSSMRKRYTRQMFIDWKNWEKDSLNKLAEYYHQMEEVNCVAADYILCMMKDNEEEIKYLERQIIEYDAVDWDIVYIMSKQDEMHDCYKEKTNKLEI